MAVILQKSHIDPEVQQQLHILLTVNPQEKRRGPVRRKSDGVSVYTIEVAEDGTEYIRIPIFFGLQQLGPILPALNIENKSKLQIEFKAQLFQYQKDYANSVVERFNTTRATGLTLYPGAGKTTIGVALTCKVGLATVILVHDEGLISQWVKSFQSRSNASVWAVGSKQVPSRPDVVVCLYTRTCKISPKLRSQIGLVIVDEAHEYCNPSGVKAILDFEPIFLLMLTATWNKDNQMHKVLELMAGPPISGPLTVPFRVTKITTPYTAVRVKRGQNLDWTSLIQSLLYCPERCAQIVTIVRWLVEVRKRKVIIMTTEVEHVKLLNKMLTEGGVESCDWLAQNKQQYRDSSVLVGNVQKCGTGFDEEMYCDDWKGQRIDTVVLVSSFKETSLLAQVIGRTFRSSDPWVLQLVDEDDTVKSHWRICRRWYLDNMGTLTPNLLITELGS